MPQSNSRFILLPSFRFSIEGDREGKDHIRIERSVVIDADHPNTKPIDLPEDKLDDYLLLPIMTQSALVLAETGIVDPVVFRKHRLRERLKAGPL